MEPNQTPPLCTLHPLLPLHALPNVHLSFFCFVFLFDVFSSYVFFFLRLSSLDSEPDIRIAQRVVRKTNQPSGYLYQNEGGLEGGHFMACSVAD